MQERNRVTQHEKIVNKFHQIFEQHKRIAEQMKLTLRAEQQERITASKLSRVSRVTDHARETT